jgi:hypothetical protein
MGFKILCLATAIVSMLGAWAWSAVILWPMGQASRLFELAERFGTALFLVNFLFILLLAYKMFIQDKYMYSKGFTLLAPIVGSLLIAAYFTILGYNKPRREIEILNPAASEQQKQGTGEAP